MKIDVSSFDPAYEVIILDVIKRLKKTYPKYRIETVQKHYKISDNKIKLFVNNMPYSLNMEKYIEESCSIGEDKAFENIQVEIQNKINKA